MCLAFPGKIIEVKGDKSIINFSGAEREIITAFVDAGVGDYVLVHAGVAIEKINKKDAWQAMKMYD